MAADSEFLAKFLVPGYLLASMDRSGKSKLVLPSPASTSPTGSGDPSLPGGKNSSNSLLPYLEFQNEYPLPICQRMKEK